jgi:divalent anion:Na+ symporter, DASS family
LADEHHEHDDSKLKKTMGYISQVCFQTNLVTSAMFLTAMAANPLIQSFANKAGADVTWANWALGAIVPGLISLALMPLIIYALHPPAIKTSPEAPAHALEALKNMGKISVKEVIMLVTFIALILGWILDKKIGLDATAVALLGVVALLVTGVLEWDDAIKEKGAWDSFIWFSVMVMLSGYLAEYGVIKLIGGKIGAALQEYPAMVAVPALMLVYFYAHYLFASTSAHVTVLFTTFLFLITGFDVPIMVAAMVLAYFSSLSGGLTHYGIATAPIYYGTKSVTTRQWWTIGFLVSLINIAIWGGVGSIWWKYLGWF